MELCLTKGNVGLIPQGTYEVWNFWLVQPDLTSLRPRCHRRWRKDYVRSGGTDGSFPAGFARGELSCSLSTVEVNPRVEAWALGAMLVQLASGVRMFHSMVNVLEFATFGDVESNEARRDLRAPVQASLLRLWYRKAKDCRCVTDWLEQTDFSYTFWKLGFLAGPRAIRDGNARDVRVLEANF